MSGHFRCRSIPPTSCRRLRPAGDVNLSVTKVSRCNIFSNSDDDLCTMNESLCVGQSFGDENVNLVYHVNLQLVI